MMFDDEPVKIIDGHKFWKPQDYKGFQIVPYEAPDGDRSFMVGDGKQWVYQSKKLEDCGVHIDMMDTAKKFTKRGRK